MRVVKKPPKRTVKRRAPVRRQYIVKLKLPYINLEPQLLFSSPLRPACYQSPPALACLPGDAPLIDYAVSSNHIYTEELLEEALYEPGPLNWSLYDGRDPNTLRLPDYPSSESFPGSYYAQCNSFQPNALAFSTPKQAKVYTHLYPEYDTTSQSPASQPVLNSSPLEDTFSYSEWFKAPSCSMDTHNSCQCLGCNEMMAPVLYAGVRSIDPRLLVKPSDIQTSEMTIPSDATPSDPFPESNYCEEFVQQPFLDRLKSANHLSLAPGSHTSTPKKRSLKFIYTFMDVSASHRKQSQSANSRQTDTPIIIHSSPLKSMCTEEGFEKKVALDNMVFYKESGRTINA